MLSISNDFSKLDFKFTKQKSFIFIINRIKYYIFKYYADLTTNTHRKQ